jgi:hypothetical protein
VGKKCFIRFWVVDALRSIKITLLFYYRVLLKGSLKSDLRLEKKIKRGIDHGRSVLVHINYLENEEDVNIFANTNYRCYTLFSQEIA